MDIFLIILAVLFVLVGIAGSVLPVLPGPPIAYIGLWFAQWSQYGNFSTRFMVWTGVAMVIVSVIDNILPPYITKSSGGSKYAAIGSVVGMLVGMFFTSIGIILGMLLGAFIGEWIFAKQSVKDAFKASLGAFAGFVLGTGIKLFYCFYLLYCIIF